MKFVESVRLLVILADVLGSILIGVVCRCLLLGVLYCIILYCIEMMVIAVHPVCSLEFWYLDVNLPIKFCSEAYFFRLEVLYRALNLTLGTPSLKSLPEDLYSGFLRSEKLHRPQSGLNPLTLDLEASTLPRDHRGPLILLLTN